MENEAFPVCPPTSAPSIVWFRRDLRVEDQPALAAALARGRPTLAVWILDGETDGVEAPGGAARWWLDQSLRDLERSLMRRNVPLVLRRGPAFRVILDLVASTGADAVFWNRVYLPGEVARDTALKAELAARGVLSRSWNGSLLLEPWEVRPSGGRHRTFSGFWTACMARGIEPVLLPAPGEGMPWPAGTPVPASDDLGLAPRPDWAAGLRETWTPGEAGARERLARFLKGPMADYEERRDVMAEEGTSRLSPHLAWGEISPGQVWRAVSDAAARNPAALPSARAVLRQLGWREFAWHTAFAVPDLARIPLDPRAERIAWREDAVAFEAWTRGRTGLPLVDAGMRQLWRTGWMHNRARMVCASYLAKLELLPWQSGEAWFRDTLVDADPALNALNWQWAAGTGADAAPFFRIMSPVRQAERFDPEGDYIRRWVPELGGLDRTRIHAPWTASPGEIDAAGIHLGSEYLRPRIDLGMARNRALAAWKASGEAADVPSGG